MSRRNNIILNIDWVLMGIFLFFILVGWINIYAAAYNPEHKSIFDFTQDYGKQFLWIIIALVIGLCIMIIDAKFFSTFSLVIYIFSIILLLLTIFIGKEIHGSKSW
ncbi:MAG: FtsW/RodA/SpoVE family cell cycle protein, partial [Bacteroidales bacterium]